MAYLGLVPGEHSSGPHRRLGAITKAGNSPARRFLVEIAQHYDHPAPSRSLCGFSVKSSIRVLGGEELRLSPLSPPLPSPRFLPP